MSRHIIVYTLISRYTISIKDISSLINFNFLNLFTIVKNDIINKIATNSVQTNNCMELKVRCGSVHIIRKFSTVVQVLYSVITNNRQDAALLTHTHDK